MEVLDTSGAWRRSTGGGALEEEHRRRSTGGGALEEEHWRRLQAVEQERGERDERRFQEMCERRERYQHQTTY